MATYFDTIADNALFEARYIFWIPQKVDSRDALMALMRATAKNILTAQRGPRSSASIAGASV